MNVEWMTEQVEGKPAPMPLLAVQSFANSIDVETDTDWLDSTDATATWLRGSGLATPELRVTPALLGPSKTLREAVRRLLVANEQNTVDREAGKALAELASYHRVPLTADKNGKLELDLSPAKTPNELMAHLLGIIFHAQSTGTWPRLKLCENPDCAWAFYDNSRNRSGSWCRMGQCGNRLKNRTYRERRRQSG